MTALTELMEVCVKHGITATMILRDATHLSGVPKTLSENHVTVEMYNESKRAVLLSEIKSFSPVMMLGFSADFVKLLCAATSLMSKKDPQEIIDFMEDIELAMRED